MRKLRLYSRRISPETDAWLNTLFRKIWDDYYVQGNFFPLKAEVVESLKNILYLNGW